MLRSVRPYLEEAGITDPVVCYQGAAVIDPTSGSSCSTSRSRSRPPVRRSPCSAGLGYPPNCYVDDRLYVDRQTEYSRMYAGFQHIPVEEVGDLTAWLERPPTKLVAVAEPAEIPALREAMVEAFGDRLFLDDLAPLSPRARESRGLERDRHRLRCRASSGISLDADRLVRRRRERHRADRGGRVRDRRRGREPAAARTGRLDLPERRTRRASPP